jgi:hypothetical protein
LWRIGPNNRREHVLAKLRNPEPTMPQWKVTLATTKKTRKRQHFQAWANYDTGCSQCNYRTIRSITQTLAWNILHIIVNLIQ